MGKFAKVFDIGDDQLLVFTRLNEKESPSLQVVTEFKTMELECNISFNPKSESDTDFEKAWAACDKAFLLVGEDEAIGLRKKLIAQVS